MAEETATTELDFEQRFTRALKGVGLSSLPEEDPTEVLDVGEPHLDDVEKKTADIRPATPINLFQHPDAHPIALDLALLRRYGPEWLTWEAETLELRIPIDFRTQSLSSLNLEKLMAVKTMHLTDDFWKRWEVLVPCSQALNDVFPDFEVMQVPTYGELLVAADIGGRIRADVTWSEEVESYIRVVMAHDGIFFGIEPLAFQPTTFSGIPIELTKIEEAWPGVRISGRAPTGDTIEDEQLRRVLNAHLYLEQNRQRLRDQLPLVLTT